MKHIYKKKILWFCMSSKVYFYIFINNMYESKIFFLCEQFANPSCLMNIISILIYRFYTSKTFSFPFCTEVGSTKLFLIPNLDNKIINVSFFLNFFFWWLLAHTQEFTSTHKVSKMSENCEQTNKLPTKSYLSMPTVFVLQIIFQTKTSRESQNAALQTSHRLSMCQVVFT